MAAVPETNDVYPLLGRPQDSLEWSNASYNVSFPTYHGATFDASTTNLSYSIGDKLSVKLSFLSPITPSSTLRQSIPAAYLTVFVEGSADLDLYSDVNGEWVSGNRGNEIRWELTQPGPGKESAQTSIKTWKVRRSSEQLFTEFADRAEWGTLHFSAPVDVNHQAGVSRTLRQHFSEKGSLNNEIDGSFRQIMDEEPVFAFSKSFKLGPGAKGDSVNRNDSVVFSFALVQDPVVQFASARGLTYMRPFWASYFHSADELVAFHYNDFNAASALARNYSDTLAKDAYESGSTDYQDIAALSARQVLGATQFSGTPENPIIFLKEISSNGNFQTVDVIFPAFPFFLYTNPKWLAYLLEPLLEHQLSGQYPNDYSMHDLGAHFPNATGHSDGRDEYMPVEECGNMLIMGLALVNSFKYDTEPAFIHAQVQSHKLPFWKKYSSQIDACGIDAQRSVSATGSKAAEKWIGRSYRLWKQWTGYLVREALIPHNQLSTDDFAGWLANQTNLALKGIIGIRAMSEIADLVGEKEDAKFYLETAQDYIEKWQEYGISRDKTHAKLAYTWYGSWTTIYNLYADSLLCFHIDEEDNEKGEGTTTSLRSLTGAAQKPFESDKKKRKVFIPNDVYEIQSDWYHAVLQRYGLPLDSRHLYAKSDWEFFAAAVTSRTTRGEILERVAVWVNETVTG